MGSRKCQNEQCGKRFKVPNDTPSYVRWCQDNEECKVQVGIQEVRKARVRQERAAKKQLRERKKENAKQKRQIRENDRKYQFKKAKESAQRLANLLDKDLPCICCDEPRGNAQFCGGHCRTAGGNPEIALEIRNIHGQRNKYCNEQKSGNIEGDKHSKGFKQGIVDRYGAELLDWIYSYHEPKHYTCEELMAIKKMYNAEIRNIESGNPPSRNWRSPDYDLRDLLKELEGKA